MQIVIIITIIKNDISHLPAMVIVPLVGSIILKSARLRLDFPAPVRPTIPTFRFSSSRFHHLSTQVSSPSRYRRHPSWSSQARRAALAGTWWRTHQTWSLLCYKAMYIKLHQIIECQNNQISSLISPVDGHWSARGSADSHSASWGKFNFHF